MRKNHLIKLISLVLVSLFTLQTAAQRTATKKVAPRPKTVSTTPRKPASSTTAQKQTATAKSVVSAAKGVRQTLDSISIVCPSELVFVSSHQVVDEYASKDGSLRLYTLPTANAVTLKELDVMQKNTSEAAKNNNLEVDEMFEMLAKSKGFAPLHQKSARGFFETYLAKSFMQMYSSLNLDRGIMGNIVYEQKPGHTIMHAVNSTKTVTFGAYLDLKSGKIKYLLMVQAGVDNTSRMLSMKRASELQVNVVKKEADSLAVANADKAFAQSFRDKKEDLMETAKPKGKNLTVTVEQSRIQNGIKGALVSFSFDVENAHHLAQNAVSVGCVVSTKDNVSKSELFANVKAIVNPSAASGNAHFSGTFFIPYHKIKYRVGQNNWEFGIVAFDSNTEDTLCGKEIKDSVTITQTNLIIK